LYYTILSLNIIIN